MRITLKITEITRFECVSPCTSTLLFTMKKNTIFYKEFFTLYIALVLQNVVTLSVNLADNIMLGAYSETSLAGVAAANQIQFVYQMLLGAFGEGMVILGSQYWGKNGRPDR